MAFTPQGFVSNNTPVVTAAFLNGIDVTCNFVLGGATTVAQALAALGLSGGGLTLSNPVTVAQGGTGATTAVAALAALGLSVPVTIAQGGTGATTAAAALTALGAVSTTAAALLAPLANPALTGIPIAPTAAPGVSTTQIATTAFAGAAAAAVSSAAVTAATAAAVAAAGPAAIAAIGGLIIKGGQIALSNGANTVNFPTAFPTSCVSVVLTPNGGGATVAITSFGATGFTCNVGVTEQYTYIALGD
jgi:hypothetical protein